MFYTHGEDSYTQLLEGIYIKTLVYGEKTLTAQFKLEKGSKLPLHKHPHEQTGYMVSGRMKFTVAEKTHIVEPGDSWCIEGNIQHGAEALEDAIVIEVFTPVRGDYLPQTLANRK